MENKMATPLGIKVFFRNKETMLQCNGKSVEPITVETLVIHFDQEKLEKLLFGVVQHSMHGSIGGSP